MAGDEEHAGERSTKEQASDSLGRQLPTRRHRQRGQLQHRHERQQQHRQSIDLQESAATELRPKRHGRAVAAVPGKGSHDRRKHRAAARRQRSTADLLSQASKPDGDRG